MAQQSHHNTEEQTPPYVDVTDTSAMSSAPTETTTTHTPSHLTRTETRDEEESTPRNSVENTQHTEQNLHHTFSSQLNASGPYRRASQPHNQHQHQTEPSQPSAEQREAMLRAFVESKKYIQPGDGALPGLMTGFDHGAGMKGLVMGGLGPQGNAADAQIPVAGASGAARTGGVNGVGGVPMWPEDIEKEGWDDEDEGHLGTHGHGQSEREGRRSSMARVKDLFKRKKSVADHEDGRNDS